MDANEEKFTGRQWLNIMEMTRYSNTASEVPIFEQVVTKKWEANFIELMGGHELSMKNIEVLKTNLGKNMAMAVKP